MPVTAMSTGALGSCTFVCTDEPDGSSSSTCPASVPTTSMLTAVSSSLSFLSTSMHVHAVCCTSGRPFCSATNAPIAPGSSSPSRSCERDVSVTPLSRRPASASLACSTEARPSLNAVHISFSFSSTVSIGSENL
jgi:hypothetical protein